MSLKIIGTITVLILSLATLKAQVEYLRLSPAQKIEQRVGMTDLTIEYSRPQMKGRKIFGELVPFNKMWRTGANENTTVAFNHRVKIGNTEVAAGKYTLWTKPMPNEWAIYFYTDTNNLDVPTPIDSTKLIYLTTVKAHSLNRQQKALVINIYNLTETTAELGISWEKTEVLIPMTFYTREAMEKKVTKAFQQNIFDYSITASYYSQRGIELEKAKELQELAMKLKGTPTAWDHYSYANILMQLKDKMAAKKHASQSLKMARTSNNLYLITENEKLLNTLGN